MCAVETKKELGKKQVISGPKVYPRGPRTGPVYLRMSPAVSSSYSQISLSTSRPIRSSTGGAYIAAHCPRR